MSKKIKNRKRSDVWLHFDKDNRTTTKCKYCSQHISISCGNISNLRRHLKAKHPCIFYENGTTKTKQITDKLEKSGPDLCIENEEFTVIKEEPPVNDDLMEDYEANSYTIDSTSSSREIIADQELVRMIALDFQPFNIVEDNGFINLLKALNPSYSPPNRHTITQRMLPDLYRKVKGDLRSMLRDVDGVCLSIDSWNTRTDQRYMLITCHFIHNFCLKNKALECCDITDLQTPEELARQLKRVVEDWGIQDHINAVVTDRTRIIVKTVKEVLKWTHIECIAHSLNEVVKNSLEGTSINSIILKAKTLSNYMSRHHAIKLQEIQAQMGQPLLKPKHHYSNRWNLALDMIQRLIDIRKPLTLALLNVNPILVPILSEEEWENLEETCETLKPFEEMITEMSSEKFIVGSKAILIVRGLQRFIQHKRKTPSKSSSVRQLVDNLSREIKERLAPYEEKEVLGDATLLDPRFKEHGFINDDIAEKTKNRLELSIVQSVESSMPRDDEEEEEILPTIRKPLSVVWADFEERVTPLRHKPRSLHSKAILEMKGYLNEKLIPLSNDPLEWWKSQVSIYKNLSKISLSRLCVVATCIPPEMIFFERGQIMYEKRKNLPNESMNEIIFLNANLKR